MGNCSSCQGEKIASTCVVWEGMTVPFDTFNKLIEYIYTKVNTEEEKIDIKTLSEDKDISLTKAVQILIDRQVKNLYSSTSTSTSASTCNINISSLDNCSTCNKTFCEKLQILVNEVALLRAEVNQLKLQI